MNFSVYAVGLQLVAKSLPLPNKVRLMCGIVGLYLKNPALESQLGRLFEPMLEAMTDRGPDSAGFAIYGDEVAQGWVKLTLQATTEQYDFKALIAALQSRLDAPLDWFQNASAVVLKIQAEEAPVRAALAQLAPTVRIMSAGQSIEILKGMGLPREISERFGLASMKGSHIIGHTRMATESAVTMEGSHPFSTGSDLCLVHNGSLSNHFRLRQNLRREGIHFETDNDTEVAAGYLAWRLQQGDSLKQALDKSLEDLDGFFTFAIGTRNGFAVIRDPIACKPAILAETDDYVAMASEYQALSSLPGIENARVWEPVPATMYIWEREPAEGARS
ncbi:Glutamine amidotransferase, s-II protein [Pseudomonas savastanoi pv. glycinea]|uniref:Glutamate synthase GltB1 subunit n=14 Tax=Pseudomonas syringae group genomosp. 2 TaxID=251698 RepID=A0A3M5G9L8_PSESS|nr:Glutamine amidotransferase, s-II protein [Pseudomonas amygdali pv. eriobotryae]KPX35729.1 Glutamate synthase GltB1 subunit [Pseudomonas savastanoi pv. glycinea]KPX90278.1 Glutamine amidotransferase, class-II protein [Pseudomonas meliae]KUG41548.1 Glutamate synthase GltB1 subunit [Pseudomonas savastanoi pv. fraxini]RMR43949.1 Glutamine amidotransferase, s-II protein [Pseudomonas amygdali pv. mori]RMS83267.1 Glutamine amidotransferase, s-II protein [Pseudomonas savastanoi]RMT04529.1 Glutamat